MKRLYTLSALLLSAAALPLSAAQMPDQEPGRITVKDLPGNVYQFNVAPNMTIEHVKDMIEDRTKDKKTKYNGVDAERQRLMFKGKQCENTDTLAACGIKPGGKAADATIHMQLRLGPMLLPPKQVFIAIQTVGLLQKGLFSPLEGLAEAFSRTFAIGLVKGEEEEEEEGEWILKPIRLENLVHWDQVKAVLAKKTKINKERIVLNIPPKLMRNTGSIARISIELHDRSYVVPSNLTRDDKYHYGVRDASGLGEISFMPFHLASLGETGS